MSYKLFITGLLFFAVVFSAASQKIVVDTSSTSRYLIKPENVAKPEVKAPSKEPAEELTFSDRALSIGKGILNRLKARLNLEEASESLKEKKNKILGKPEEEEKKEEDG
ncbi:hypothetical protein [Ekhidna sp.]